MQFSNEKDVNLTISTAIKVTKGSKVVRKYAKPKSISFSDKKLTINEGDHQGNCGVIPRDSATLDEFVRFY